MHTCREDVRYTTSSYTDGMVSSETDAEGNVTNYTRNTRGLPTVIVEAYGTADERTTEITWHSTFSLPTEVEAPGRTADLTYDIQGRLTEFTITDTSTHTTPYSTNGQTRTWSYDWSTTGQLESVDGPLAGTGDTITYAYDTNGYLESVTDEVGLVTEVTSVDWRGAPLTIEDPNGVETALTYDIRGRLLTATIDPGPNEAEYEFEYDAVGDITRITPPDGAYLEYSWDMARRLTQVEDNAGNTIQYTHDDMGNPLSREIEDSSSTLLLAQSATFDELGRLLTFTGAASQSWSFGYDKLDNRVSVEDPRSNIYEWGFDALSRLVSETDEGDQTIELTRNGADDITVYEDPRDIATTYIRNGFGDVIQRESPDTGTTVFKYNALGLATEIEDARGVVTQLAYDEAGRMTAKTYPASTAENVTYTYDEAAGGNYGKGRLTKIQDGSGSVSFVYDALGRKIEEAKVTGSATYTVAYEYDAAGNIIQMTYPSGRIVAFARDSQGRIDGVTTKEDAQSASVTLADSVTHEPFGPLQSFWYGNGLNLWRIFTDDYLLSQSIVEDLGTSTVYINKVYGRLDDLNLTNIWDNVNSTEDQSFWYTATNRLQNADGPWGELLFYHDGAGNRVYRGLADGTTVTEEVYGYPGDSNRLQGISVASSPVREFNHDAAGNIIEDDRGGTVYHYRYNDRNRLDQLTVGTTVTTYAYDGLERMALRTTASPAATTHYVYDTADRLIAEADDTGQTVREYIWFDDLPLAVVADVDTASPHLYYVHADHLNRPVMMTDDSGSTVWEATYWPFGEAYSITGSAANNLRFPGQYFLIESGLAYNWHRHYDATLGRYTQPDPLLYGLADADGVEPSLLAGMPSASEAGTIAQMMRATPMPGGISSGPSAFDTLDKLQIQTPDGRKSLAAANPKGIPSEYKDGPSLCAYGKSSPLMRVDPTGLAASAMSPIPQGLDGATCVNLDCAQVISQCKAQCIGIYSGDIPGTLPGTGHDMFGRYRRCVRECAALSGCADEY